MPYRITQETSLKGGLSPKQTQRLMQSPEMQQALKILQLPVLELSQVLVEEMEKNPLLETSEEEEDDAQKEEGDEGSENDPQEESEMEFEKEDFSLLTLIDDSFTELSQDFAPSKRTEEDEKRQSYLENSILDEPSLHEYLLKQASESIEDPSDIKVAQWLIGNIDEQGFITTPLKEIAGDAEVAIRNLERVLTILQTFDPPGICAQNLKDSMLIQLKRLNKEGGLAWKIVYHHWAELLQNYIPIIAKKLKVTTAEVNEEIEQVIAKLDNHPGLSHSKRTTHYLIPDVSIEEQEGILKVLINHEPLPTLSLNRSYLKMLLQENLPIETKKFIEEKMVSAKWLMRTVSERSSTLERIMSTLLHINRDYFLEVEGKIKPLTMKKVAEELQLHESTIARAVQNKYVQTPRGIVPIRSFFTSSFEGSGGEAVSSKTVKEIILEAVDKEDKNDPLSDEVLSQIIQGKGIKCARRTVAKFRALLNLGNRHQRRKY